ncbi:hypothetical protein HYDPIDRAFT_130837 [Hydnomerulius pinastri MD-312]|nr:hypothetical protein HYDPIDRAFT_130837 [Hydnomerulius pinastri MD-312]
MADAEEPVVPGPNPFVLDDSDEGTTSEGGSKDGGAEDEVTSPQEEEIALAQSLPSPAQSPAPAPAPAPPPTRTTSGSPAPMYLPRLTAPSMFLPIPNTDPLSSLLTKYVTPERRPRRDVAGEYTGRDVHEMVMSNSWRALAKMARDRIVASDPEDLARILDLWSLRLSSLARLRLTNQASAECTNLFAVLNAVPPSSVPGSFPGSGSLPPSIPLPSSPAPPASLPLSPAGLGGLAQLPSTPGQKSSALPSATAPRTVGAGANELTHPFELTVLHARVHYWAGDTLGYVDALSGILGRCKERAREEGRVVMQRRREREETRKGGEARKEKVESDKDGQEDSKDDAETADESQEDEDDDDEGEEEEGEDEEVEEEQDDEILIAAEANLSMWLERAARVCLILASQLVEMKDYQAAITLLDPLCTHRAPPTFLPTPSPALHSALGRVYLLSGNLQKASEHFEVIASSGDEASKEMVTMNKALLSAAVGDWARAEEALSEVVGDEPGNITALNNLSVVLLSQGRIKEGIELLESALKASPSSVVVAEPFLFNLSTLYELRSATALEKKRDLLIEVAKWSGDGLKTTCLKMPSN